METLIGIVLIFLLFRFGGSLLDGLFAAVGVMGKLVGFILGVIIVYLLLTGGCG